MVLPPQPELEGQESAWTLGVGSSQGKQKGARPRGLGHLTRTPPTPPVLAARGSLGLEAGAEATGAGRARGEGGGHRGAPAGHVDSGAVLWGAGGTGNLQGEAAT